MPAVRITNHLSTAVPQIGTLERSVTITIAAPLIVAPLNEQTQAVFITITGGQTNLTFDGTEPTQFHGHLFGLEYGEKITLSPIMAKAAKAFSNSGDPVVFYMTELNYL